MQRKPTERDRSCLARTYRVSCRETSLTRCLGRSLTLLAGSDGSARAWSSGSAGSVILAIGVDGQAANEALLAEDGDVVVAADDEELAAGEFAARLRWLCRPS